MAIKQGVYPAVRITTGAFGGKWIGAVILDPWVDTSDNSLVMDKMDYIVSDDGDECPTWLFDDSYETIHDTREVDPELVIWGDFSNVPEVSVEPTTTETNKEASKDSAKTYVVTVKTSDIEELGEILSTVKYFGSIDLDIQVD